MPKGVSPDVLSFWSPDANGVVQNDFLFVPRNAEKPALAHHFLNFILDEKNAYNNFIQFVGYTPPQNGDRRRRADQEEADPRVAAGARSSGQTSSRRTRSCSRSRAKATTSGKTPGRSSRQADAVALALACACVPGRRVAHDLLPGGAVRGAVRRARQPGHARAAGARSGTRSTGTSGTWSRRCGTSGKASSS